MATGWWRAIRHTRTDGRCSGLRLSRLANAPNLHNSELPDCAHSIVVGYFVIGLVRGSPVFEAGDAAIAGPEWHWPSTPASKRPQPVRLKYAFWSRYPFAYEEKVASKGLRRQY